MASNELIYQMEKSFKSEAYVSIEEVPCQILPKAIIFDLGDVLFTWSSDTTTSLPAQTVRNIKSSAIWMEYESGRMTQETCYCQVAQRFLVPAQEVSEAFSQARDSLQPNKAMVSFIQELKEAFQGAVKVYAMSNISREDYAFLLTKMADWSVFDRVFISGDAGMRKPELGFYRHVLEETKLAPEEVVFFDDKVDNVLAARSLGIDGIVFKDNRTVVHTLSDLFDDPVRRAYAYLYRNAKRFYSITENGAVVPEIFAELLILDVTQDLNLVNIEKSSKRTWNFFKGEPVLIPSGYFPDDLDTTSLALKVLRPHSDVVSSVLDEMLGYVNSDGTIQVYFDRNKPRTDIVVCANVLACFYTFGRGRELEPTLQLIHNVLLHRTYMQGTHYYPSPDCCLYFFGRLLQSSNDAHLQTTLGPLLKIRTQERIGKYGSALDLAMRILTCNALGLNSDVDRRTLLDLQHEDGSWDIGWMYVYGSTGLKVGNYGVTTAMAVKAIASSGKRTGATNGL